MNQPTHQTVNGLTKIDQQDDPDRPILCVIVTIFGSASYDNLFRSVQQKAHDGRVCLWSLTHKPEFIKNLQKGLEGPTEDSVINQLKSEITCIESDSVLFNFECDDVCISHNSHFGDKTAVNQFVHYLIQSGYMVMFSCYSSAALINDWDESLFGKNPFYSNAKCGGNMTLSFEKEKLANCISKQLNIVAELSQNNSIVVNASGAPYIIPKVDEKPSDNFTTDILTKVMDHNISGANEVVGHAILKFKSGGYMIISAGHWIQLSEIKVSLDTLEKVANKNWGNDYASDLMEIKSNKQKQETQGVSSQKSAPTNQNENFSNYQQMSVPNVTNNNVQKEDEWNPFDMPSSSADAVTGDWNDQANKMAMKFIQQSAPCNYSRKNKEQQQDKKTENKK